MTDHKDHDENTDQEIIPFEERIKRRVLDDQKEGELFLSKYHAWCKEMYQFYHNAQNYETLKQKNKFPSTAIQEDVDQFVADARDKLFYANRPCTLFGREESDKADAEAKQEMMNYQDDEIGIYDIMGDALHDVATYRLCAYQVEYDEDVATEWESFEEAIPLLDEDDQPILDSVGNFLPEIDPQTGDPVVESGWRIIEVPFYKGAVVNRIDPLNLLWTQDKKDIRDEFPIMIRGNLSKKDLNRPYFIRSAIAKLKDSGEETQYEDPTWEKKTMSGENASLTGSSKKIQFLEWQGMVNKVEVYHYMIQTGQVPEEDMEQFMLELSITEKDDECWTIVGIANNDAVIELRCTPFKKINGVNIVLGNMSPGEDSILGDSISRKIEAVQRAEEDTYGMLIENIKQSVDAFWIINTEALVNIQGRATVINRAGGVLECNENVNNVAKRVEQPPVAGDIYNLLSIFKQARQDQGGLQDAVIGKGDPDAETLGEARQVLSHASLRMRDYLKTFENSFVRRLYAMRNDINTEFLTEDYIFRVLGEKGFEWKKLSPQTIRTPVDFICESSTRETNRSVVTQQMLQMIDASMGLAAQQNPLQPVRIDLMLAELAETGFAVSMDKIKQWYPGVDFDNQGVNPNIQQGQPTQPTGGGQLPQPETEEQAIVQNEARNNVNIG